VVDVDSAAWPVDVEEEGDALPVGTGPASLGPLSHPARNAAMTMATASALDMRRFSERRVTRPGRVGNSFATRSGIADV
jgi:hypothetical protein